MKVRVSLPVFPVKSKRDIFNIARIFITSDHRQLRSFENIGQFARIHQIGLHAAEIHIQIGQNRRIYFGKKVGNFDFQIFLRFDIFRRAGIFRRDFIKQSRVDIVTDTERETAANLRPLFLSHF